MFPSRTPSSGKLQHHPIVPLSPSSVSNTVGGGARSSSVSSSGLKSPIVRRGQSNHNLPHHHGASPITNANANNNSFGGPSTPTILSNSNNNQHKIITRASGGSNSFAMKPMFVSNGFQPQHHHHHQIAGGGGTTSGEKGGGGAANQSCNGSFSDSQKSRSHNRNNNNNGNNLRNASSDRFSRTPSHNQHGGAARVSVSTSKSRQRKANDDDSEEDEDAQAVRKDEMENNKKNNKKPDGSMDSSASLTARSFRSICSIRILTSLLCAFFIISTAVALLVTTFSFSMSAAQDIAEQNAVAIATKARDDVEGLLNKPLTQVLGWQYVHSQGDFKLPRDAEAENPNWYRRYWEDFTSAMAAASFAYQYAVFGFDDGNYVGCKTTTVDRFQCRLFHWQDRPLNGSGTSLLHERNYFRNYSFIRDVFGRTTYDPRTRGWYKMVEHKPFAMAWSTVYLSAMPTLPLMDLNAAIYNETGHLLGIASLAYELNTLTTFLESLVTTENTVSVLIDNEDLLLASSYHDPYLTRMTIALPFAGTVPANCLVSDAANGATESIMLCRAPVATYSYGPLRQLAAEHPALVKHGAPGAHRITLDGTDFFVSVVPITTALAAGMHWRFALFVPQNDIVGGIVRGRDVSIYISIAIIVAAIALCFIILTFLLRPLKSVTESMYKLATLQETDVGTAEPSRLEEIATIQGAFKVMSAELAKVKSFLPQSVLAQLYGEISSDEEEALAEMETETNSAHNRRTSQMVHSETTSCEQSLSTLQADGNTNATATAAMRSSNKDAGTFNSNSDHHTTAYNQLQKQRGNKNNHKTQLNTNLSLSTRKVSMLAVNIAGYHNHVLMSAADPVSIVAASADLVDAVVRAVNEFKGVLDGFQGDKFMASFNAVTSVGNHASAAASAALAAARTLSAVSVRGSSKTFAMTAGIASGPAIVGNMGTQAVKRFTVLGHVVTNAGILERLCKRFPETSALIGGVAINETENFFELLTCDVVNLPAPGPQGIRRSRVAAVRGSKDGGAMDEWMYSLESNAKHSRYNFINDAFAHFLNGDNHAAVKSVEKARTHVISSPAAAADITLLGGGGGAGGDFDFGGGAIAVLEYLQSLIAANIDGTQYVNPLYDYYATSVTSCGIRNAQNEFEYDHMAPNAANNKNSKTHNLPTSPVVTAVRNLSVSAGEGDVESSSSTPNNRHQTATSAAASTLPPSYFQNDNHHHHRANPPGVIMPMPNFIQASSGRG